MYEEKGLHSRIYPYTTQVLQYANEKEDGPPWVVKSRSAATRNERRGYGKAVVRVWTPSEWEPVIEGVDPSDRCDAFPCCDHADGLFNCEPDEDEEDDVDWDDVRTEQVFYPEGDY